MPDFSQKRTVLACQFKKKKERKKERKKKKES